MNIIILIQVKGSNQVKKIILWIINIGAYIFRPDTNSSLKYDEKIEEIHIYNGELVQQMNLIHEKYTSHIRMFNDLSNILEVETYLHPLLLESDKDHGREIILNVKAQYLNQDNNETEFKYLTDSNSLFLIERQIDYELPVEAQLFPISSQISILNQNTNKSLR